MGVGEKACNRKCSWELGLVVVKLIRFSRASWAVAVLLFVSLSATSQSNAQSGPADPQASEATKALYQRLWKLRERGVMIGHQDAAVYGHDWKYDGEMDIKRVTGKHPAVYGWELGELGLGKEENLDGVSFAEMRRQMIWAHENGGINTVSWHGVNALTGGDAWDTSSKQVVASVLPGGEKEAAYAEMLERLAAFFLSLQTDGGERVPFIFRPYHEHTGSWFWWGKNLCTENEYKELWKYTLEFLRERGVHSMLTAYSPASGLPTEASYLNRYPGSGYVDILGFDAYQRGADGGPQYIDKLEKAFAIVEPIAQREGKLLILAETGLESIPVNDWWTGTLWPAIEERPVSYVLFWRNAYDRADHFYVPFPGQASADDFKRFEAKEGTLFLEDIRE